MLILYKNDRNVRFVLFTKMSNFFTWLHKCHIHYLCDGNSISVCSKNITALRHVKFVTKQMRIKLVIIIIIIPTHCLCHSANMMGDKMWSPSILPVIGENSMCLYMSHFAYACKTEGENGISRLISETA